MPRIMFLDLEVENNPYYGQIASPLHEDNYVVAVGWALDEQPYSGEVQHTYYPNKHEAQDWLDIPDDVWLIVCHNASFEIDWMWQTQPQKLTEFINRGGRIFCTQLGHYRLSGQRDIYPSLDEIAPEYGGSNKIDAVTLLWEQGVLTSDIDKDLLVEYLAGPEGDIENTRLCFWGQYEKLVQRGMWDTVLEQCDGLLYNAVCMSNGIHVDRDTAYANLAKLTETIDTLETKFLDTIEEFPAAVQQGFKVSSLNHKSAWIYGGNFRVVGRVPSVDKDGNPRYEKVTAVFDEDTEQHITVYDDAALDALIATRPNLTKFKSGKRKGQVKTFRIDSDTIRMRTGHIEHTAPGLINLNDYPKEFLDVFLKEYTTKLVQYDGSPVYSSSEEAVAALLSRPETPKQAKQVLQHLNQWATLNKVVGSFYIRNTYNTDGTVRNTSGALQNLTPNNKIHHRLNICATTTGRLSSSQPNLQNLPTDDSAGVMEWLGSRYGDDGVMLEADFSGLEVVVLADLSKDQNLMDVVLSGKSMHTINAAAIKGITYEEYDAILKDEDHPQHREFDKFRDECKPKEFSANYGASAHGVAYAAGCSLEEAEEFIAMKRQMFPQVEEFVTEVTEQVESNTQTFREQNDEGTYRVYQVGTWKSPGGIEYSFRTYPVTRYTNNGPVEVMEFKPTQIRNYPIQGEASLFVQCATGWLIRELFRYEFFGGKVTVVNTVHDSVWLDVHTSVLPQVAKLVQSVLEYIPQGMKRLGYNLELPYTVDITTGPNLQDQHSFNT